MKYSYYLTIIAIIWAIYAGIKSALALPDISEETFKTFAENLGQLLVAVGIAYNDIKTGKTRKTINTIEMSLKR